MENSVITLAALILPVDVIVTKTLSFEVCDVCASAKTILVVQYKCEKVIFMKICQLLVTKIII